MQLRPKVKIGRAQTTADPDASITRKQTQGQPSLKLPPPQKKKKQSNHDQSTTRVDSCANTTA